MARNAKSATVLVACPGDRCGGKCGGGAVRATGLGDARYKLVTVAPCPTLLAAGFVGDIAVRMSQPLAGAELVRV